VRRTAARWTHVVSCC